MRNEYEIGDEDEMPKSLKELWEIFVNYGEPDDLVEECASRFCDASELFPEWAAATEEQREGVREGIRAVVTWFRDRPEPH